LGRLVRSYLHETRLELLQTLRAPAFAFPFLLLPLPIYLFFGVLLAGSSEAVRESPQLADYILSGWCVFAVSGPGIFAIGCGLALEREGRLLALKRALPVPAGGYLFAKMAMAMLFAAFAVALLVVTALLVGDITLGPLPLIGLVLVMIVGAIPFGAIGLFIGAYASGSAAPAFGNLVYLPMLWLSGLFFPLPELLRPWAIIWPAFHLNQTAMGIAGVTEYSFVDPLFSAAVLVGISVLFGGLALRRLATVG
jgi:ABC-2 type transport system permease protein